MEQELISIIVPVYNIEKYLPRCVHSLCAQTYKQIEILLVDDGSTDGTGALCDRLAQEDDRIRVFHRDNGGPSAARNYGIVKARGAYLGFVDSDDYVEPDMYESLYHEICNNRVYVAQIGRDEWTEDGSRLPDICVPPMKTECIPAEDFMRELLMHKGDCSFCTKLLKKELFEDMQFPVGVLNEDFHLLVHILFKVESIASLPKRGYHVCYRMGSNTRKEHGFSRVFMDNVNNADMVAEIVKKQYPSLTSVAFRFGIFQRLDYMLHVPVDQMNKENDFYRSVVKYLRKNWFRAMTNPYLTRKNKVYHTIFALAPAMSRRIHARLKRS